MPIRVLSEQLASQIAAGEVVERPASVVKELVENAIDAGATAVSIEVRDGGRALIQVADDGSGIAESEAETAFLRHATSKLESAAGLEAIRTLGFRGEALAAIASVSRLTIVTRTAEAAAGVRLQLTGGVVQSRERVGAPPGTVIAVSDLFFNTPARLKFLKSATAERRAIDEFVSRYALAYPHMRWRLAHNGRIALQTGGDGDLRAALADVYGVETARALLPIRETDEYAAPDLPAPEPSAEEEPEPGGAPLRVSGYVSPPELQRANRSQITLFVNGRWVHDQQLTYAVIEAYHTLIPSGRYPLAVIFITLPPEDVDVNVHPAKAEVRFRRPRAVFGAVQRAVRRTLLDSDPLRRLPDNPFDEPAGPARALAGDAFAWWRRPRPEPEPLALQHPDPLPPAQAGETFGRPASPPTPPLGGARLPILRVIGQVGAAYIIAEGPEGLFLIDQHAAHERILFEQMLAAAAARAMPTQQLVAGQAVQVTPAQAALLEERLDWLAGLGFLVEPFGPGTFLVRGVPALLAGADPGRALWAAVEALEADETPLRDTLEAAVLRRVCKAAAVKAGQLLSQAEMETLVRQLEACEVPHTCPHGRPTLIHLSVAQLARQFGRT